MKTPEEWLDQQTADRPDDFAPEERAPALAWVAAIQADARIGRLAGLIAFLGRLFCHHRYRWVANIHGDAINHHGGLRSWWRCDRCGHETLSASLMPDIDALCDRLERENTIELPRDAGSPDQREVMRLVGERMHERRAKAEAAERKRAAEELQVNSAKRWKAMGDALVDGVAALEIENQRLQKLAADQQVLLARATGLEPLASSAWIACTDRMPPICQRVLAHEPHERVEIMRWGPPPDGFSYGPDHPPVWWSGGEKTNVVRWMPLPEVER